MTQRLPPPEPIPPDDPPGWTPLGGLPDADITITPVGNGYLIERKVRTTPMPPLWWWFAAFWISVDMFLVMAVIRLYIVGVPF